MHSFVWNVVYRYKHTYILYSDDTQTDTPKSKHNTAMISLRCKNNIFHHYTLSVSENLDFDILQSDAIIFVLYALKYPGVISHSLRSPEKENKFVYDYDNCLGSVHPHPVAWMEPPWCNLLPHLLPFCVSTWREKFYLEQYLLHTEMGTFRFTFQKMWNINPFSCSEILRINVHLSINIIIWQNSSFFLFKNIHIQFAIAQCCYTLSLLRKWAE